jgi:tRNA 2-selenouridine synthase
MASSLSTADFLNAPGILLDVRSPAEYTQGHIPGAISFPLFTDEERAQVGICYKQQGRNQAVELGFAIAGPKFAGLIAQAKELASDRQVRLYCWRGGMRSGAVAWVLELAGFQISLLIGGYKAFRRWALDGFAKPRSIVILGGMTGTGKTAVLTELQRQGEQVLDLEQLASHRGSSFGALGLPPQPTNEQFENRVALQWSQFHPDRPLWVEAESKRIGLCRIPSAIFQQMEQAPVMEILRSRQERLDLLVEIYGTAAVAELVAATERIRKRLGGLRTQQAIALLHQGELAQAFDLILDYYDKTYRYDLERRQVQILSVQAIGLSDSETASQLIHQYRCTRTADAIALPIAR